MCVCLCVCGPVCVCRMYWIGQFGTRKTHRPCDARCQNPLQWAKVLNVRSIFNIEFIAFVRAIASTAAAAMIAANINNKIKKRISPRSQNTHTLYSLIHVYTHSHRVQCYLVRAYFIQCIRTTGPENKTRLNKIFHFSIEFIQIKWERNSLAGLK